MSIPEKEKKSKVEVINDKWQVLIEEAEADSCPVTINTIDKQIGMTSIICKWMRYKIEWESVFELYETKRKKKFNDLWKFYKVESHLKINTKEELLNFIETDGGYTELYLISNTISRVIDFIEGTIDNLKSKNFEINRFIDWQKFTHGK